MDGQRALVYSRIRENRLDPSDNDITRGERQQQVTRAIADKLVSAGTFLRLPFSGDELLRPLATDLSANQLLQLAWVKFRAGNTIRCRLGGDPETIGGASVIRSSEENRNVISMFLDESAPQPPRPGTGTYGPGCVVGDRSLGSR
jgi:anionic cell wall polymer biosynthesis LytR-Cps2A-Psr (LCP) family protein